VHARVEITAEIVAQNVKKGPLARCFSALGCDGLDCLLLAAVWGRLHVRARLATSTGVLLGANSSTRVWADRQDLPGTRRWRCTQHMAACRNKLVSRAAIECSAGFSHSLSFLGDSPLACLACVTSRQPSRRASICNYQAVSTTDKRHSCDPVFRRGSTAGTPRRPTMLTSLAAQTHTVLPSLHWCQSFLDNAGRAALRNSDAISRQDLPDSGLTLV